MWPFDFQFLNVLFKINDKFYKHNVLSFENFPKYWFEKELIPNKYQENFITPLKVCVRQFIKNDMQMLSPWIDFSDDHEYGANVNNDRRNYNSSLKVIRLRIERQYQNEIISIIIPFFIIVVCSFSAFFISLDDIGDRLSVAITVLLTFAAYQSVLSDSLPQTNNILAIHYYTLFAYVVLLLIIVETGLVNYLSIVNKTLMEDVEWLDVVFGSVLAVMWVVCTFMYLFVLPWMSGQRSWGKLMEKQLNHVTTKQQNFVTVEPDNCIFR